jgi:hypothetical protein
MNFSSGGNTLSAALLADDVKPLPFPAEGKP